MARKRKAEPAAATATADPPGLRFRCDRADLLRAVRTAIQVTGGRTPDPTLAGVRVHVADAVRVAATDYEAWLTTEVGSDPDRRRAGELTVLHPDRLVAVLADCADERVELAGTSDDGLRIACSGGRFAFPAAAVRQAEADPPAEAASLAVPTLADLAAGLDAVLPMAGKSRVKLGWQWAADGVGFETAGGSLRVTATNFARAGAAGMAALVLRPGPDGGGVIPTPDARLVRDLAADHAARGWADADLWVERTRLVFAAGPTRLAVRFAEGKAPVVRLPGRADDRTTEVLRAPLLAAVRGIATVVGEDGCATLAATKAGLTVSARSPECGFGTVTVPAGGCDSDWAVAVRAADLARALGASPTDRVRIGPTAGPDVLAVWAGAAVYTFHTAAAAEEAARG